MEHIFIRGSRVRFIIVPDMLKNAPMVRVLPTGGLWCCCWEPAPRHVHRL